MTDGTGPAEGMLKRVISSLILIIVAIAIPVVISNVIWGSQLLTISLFGAMVGLMSSLNGGLRVGLLGTAMFTLAAPVSLAVGAVPVAGACLMAIICLLVGISAGWKRYAGFVEIPLGMAYLMTLPLPLIAAAERGPASTQFLFTVMAATAFCGLWTVGAIRLFHVNKDIPLSERHATADTVEYTVVMTVLVSVSTFFVLTYARSTHGVWLLLTLFIVLQVGPQATLHRAFQRTAGTIAGSIVAALIASLLQPGWLFTVVLIVALLGMLATLGKEPYWVYAFFLTNVILLALSSGQPNLTASFERVGYTIAGVILAVIGLAIGNLFRKKGSGDPAQDPAAPATA